MARQALGKNYFLNTNYPIMVYRVCKAYTQKQKPDKQDYTEKKHFHDFSELVIVTHGIGLHWVEGMEYTVVAGDVFLIQGEQQHYFIKRDELVFYNIMFQPEMLPLPMKELKNIPGYHAIFVLEPVYRKKHKFESHLRLDRTGLAKVEPIVKHMWQEIETQQAGFEVALLGDILQLFLLLSRQYSEVPQTSKGQSILRIAEIIGRLEKDYANSWRLSDLANLSHMSEGNLHKVFKEATGQSPIDYLIKLRLQRSMELLSDSSLSVTEIAFKTGFNDSNYFTRHFKKIIGTTPSRYRKQHLNHL